MLSGTEISTKHVACNVIKLTHLTYCLDNIASASRLAKQSICGQGRLQISFLLCFGHLTAQIKSGGLQSTGGLQRVNQGRWRTAVTYPESLGWTGSAHD